MISNISYQNYNKEHMAHVNGKDLSISTKHSVEMCSFLRNKTTSKAKQMLDSVIIKKLAVPYDRYKESVSHRKGKIAQGKYPIKVSKEFKKLIESAEANAQHKGLDKTNLIIVHMAAHKASSPWHAGRQRRRKMKRTHVEVVVKEKEIKKPKKDTKVVLKQETKQPEEKKQEKETKKPPESVKPLSTEKSKINKK